jgi:hypothetical protein
MGIVHMHGRGIFQRQWWLVGPKLLFEQVAAPVPEIIDELEENDERDTQNTL